MTKREYMHMIFATTDKYLSSSATKDFLRNFNNLSNWAKKDYEGKNFFAREKDDRFIQKLLKTLSAIVEGNIASIENLKSSVNTNAVIYTQALKSLQEKRTTPKAKREKYEKWENLLVDICAAFYTNTFISNFLISILSKPSFPAKIEDADPFTDKVMYFFYYGKNADSHRAKAEKIYNLISQHDINIIKLMKKASSYSNDIYEIFSKEWNYHIPVIVDKFDKHFFVQNKKTQAPSDFVKLVDQEYPVLDTRFTRSGPVQFPMDLFMRTKLTEERVSMLLELITSKKSDPNISEYIRSIIMFEKKYAKTHKSYTYKGENYIQLMYERVASTNSISAFRIFDSIFPIKDCVKNPWSPLFTIQGIKIKQVQYCIDIGVDLNKEDSIIGRRVAIDKRSCALFGYDKKSKVLLYLISKGMKITKPSIYYMIAIENRDWDLLDFIVTQEPVETSDNFPLRTALYEQNLEICWFLFDQYKNPEDALYVIRDVANMKIGTDKSMHAAKQMLREIKESGGIAKFLS